MVSDPSCGNAHSIAMGLIRGSLKRNPLWMPQFTYQVSVLSELGLWRDDDSLSDVGRHWLRENTRWFVWPDERARDRVRQRAWSASVLKRDKGTCDICGRCKPPCGLEAHHLSSSFAFPRLRFVTSNGVTLCRKCHSDFHRWLGGNKVPCIKADYLTFRASQLSHKIGKVTRLTRIETS